MNGQTLTPDNPLEIHQLGFVLVSTNLVAEVETFPGTVTGMHSYGQGLSKDIRGSANVFELGTVALRDKGEGRGRDQQVTMYAPAGTESDGQLLLYVDENGAITFHKPQVEAVHQDTRQSDRMVRYDIPIRQPLCSLDQKAASQSTMGQIGTKVLKLIGWKVIGKAVREVGPPLVRRWESKHRPMRVLSRQQLSDWQALDPEALIPASERSLLFIHGAFSSVASAFASLGENQSFLKAIHARYAEHIYGFDHATLASGVTTNVMQLYHKLDAGTHNFDIICHSRGGLVARAFRDLKEAQLRQRFGYDAERGQYEDDLKAWGKKWRIPDKVEVKVNRILFVATPNNGTVLAQPLHLNKYLDVLMSATNMLPDVADITVDALLVVAKLLLNDMMPVLPGLDDVQPKSSLFDLLSKKPRLLDAAIQADYDPQPGLKAIIDGVFQHVVFGKQNDLVVPTQGVSHWSGGVINDCLPFAGQRVHHCNIFKSEKTLKRLLKWL